MTKTRPLLLVASATAVFFGVLAAPASAHHRDFTFLRDWFVPFKGEKEVEYRFFYRPDDDLVHHEFEFEYGITDHFAIEPGISFEQESGDELHASEAEVELRFNFGDYHDNAWLPALNVEYEHPLEDEGGEEEDHVEAKFIISRFDSKGNDLSINVNVGTSLGGDHDVESEAFLGYMAGLGKNERTPEGYRLGLRGGFEAKYDFEHEEAGIGPTVVYRANKHLNVLGTVMVPVGKHEHRGTEIRFLSEWEF